MCTHIHVILDANVVFGERLDFGDLPKKGALRILNAKVDPDRDACINVEQEMLDFIIGFEFSG